jgi:glycine cleavage system aminomethyltransferase T
MTQTMSLQQFIDSKPNLIEYFYNDVESPHTQFRLTLNPAPQQWSNWREEQRAWREAAVLFDQSHHMPELFLRGADALKLLTRIGVNSFASFVPGKAKMLVGCNPRGQMIGECVLYYLEKDSFELISGMHFQNWVHFNAATGGYDVSVERDHPTSENPKGRTKFRFGMDGPNAEKIFKEVVEGEAPEIPFFNFAAVKIAGCEVLALRHGMAGHKGVELSGRYSDGPKVRETLFAVGKKYGLRPAGTIAYFSACAEGGWMAYPTPAVFTGDDMRAYREWLPADSWETRIQLGGSFVSNNIEDYYVTPWDMGYDHLVKFDHDFIGREALEQMVQGPRRTAVSLLWNKEDISKIAGSMFEPGLAYKAINWPAASYSWQQNDEVRSPDGRLVGLAAFSGYTINEKEIISLALIDQAYAAPGTPVVLTWGEPNGGSRKPHVERHKQMQVRAAVAPKPYSKAVQKLQRSGLS